MYTSYWYRNHEREVDDREDKKDPRGYLIPTHFRGDIPRGLDYVFGRVDEVSVQLSISMKGRDKVQNKRRRLKGFGLVSYNKVKQKAHLLSSTPSKTKVSEEAGEHIGSRNSFIFARVAADICN